MTCEQKTSTRLSLADEAARLGANLDPQKRLQLQGVMDFLVGELRRLRSNVRLKKWKKRNPGRMREHANSWYRRNRDIVIEKNKTPEASAKKKAYAKVYQQRPTSKLNRHRYYLRNANRLRQEQREWSASEMGREYAKEYQRKRRKENPHIHFMNWMRGSVNRVLREQGVRKLGRTAEYVGCTAEELKVHLESQFTEGMTWQVPRSWDVDHICPVDSFNLNDKEEALCCCNYKNLRPLDGMKNKYKSNKIPTPLPSWIPLHLRQRILIRQNVKAQSRPAHTPLG